MREGAEAQSFQDMAGGVEGARRTSEQLARRSKVVFRAGSAVSAWNWRPWAGLSKVEEALVSGRAIRATRPADMPSSQIERAPLDAARPRRTIFAARWLPRRCGRGDRGQAPGRTAGAWPGRSGRFTRGRPERSLVATAADGVARSWQEAVEAQTGPVETARALEESREDEFLAAQKALLSDLAREQETLLSSAAAHPGLWPEGARRAAMEVARQFRDGAVTDAPSRLRPSRPCCASRQRSSRRRGGPPVLRRRRGGAGRAPGRGSVRADA